MSIPKTIFILVAISISCTFCLQAHEIDQNNLPPKACHETVSHSTSSDSQQSNVTIEKIIELINSLQDPALDYENKKETIINNQRTLRILTQHLARFQDVEALTQAKALPQLISVLSTEPTQMNNNSNYQYPLR